MGNYEAAMGYHESALELASGNEGSALQIRSATQLCGCYQAVAEGIVDAFEKEQPDDDAALQTAIAMYEKCVACSRLSKDKKLEGMSCNKLGRVKTILGEYEEAIRLQKIFLNICTNEEPADLIGEAQARGALAEAYEAVGDVNEAVEQLEILLTVA